MSFQGAWSSVLSQLRIPQDAQPGQPYVLLGGNLPQPFVDCGFRAAVIWAQTVGLAPGGPDEYYYFIAVKDATAAASASVSQGYWRAGTSRLFFTSRLIAAIDDPGNAIEITEILGSNSLTTCPAGGTVDYSLLRGPNMNITDSDVLRTSSGGFEMFDGATIWTITADCTMNVYCPINWNSAITVTDRQTTLFTTSSVSYTTAGGATCGKAFVAPPSGRVTLQWGGQLTPTGGNWIGLLSPIVRNGAVVGSGTTVLASADNNAVVHEGNGATGRQGVSYLLEGLNSGSSYNVVIQHRINNGLGTLEVSNRYVIASPEF